MAESQRLFGATLILDFNEIIIVTMKTFQFLVGALFHHGTIMNDHD